MSEQPVLPIIWANRPLLFARSCPSVVLNKPRSPESQRWPGEAAYTISGLDGCTAMVLIWWVVSSPMCRNVLPPSADFKDAVAPPAGVAVDGLPGTHPEDVGVGLIERHRPDGAEPVGIENHLPGDPSIQRLEHRPTQRLPPRGGSRYSGHQSPRCGPSCWRVRYCARARPGKPSYRWGARENMGEREDTRRRREVRRIIRRHIGFRIVLSENREKCRKRKNPLDFDKNKET